MYTAFLKRLSLFLAIGIFLISFITYNFVKRIDAPPIISESIGFDVKLKNLKSKDWDRIDLLVHGSSVSYNNLHANTLSSHLDSSITFYNTASGGLNMSQNFAFLKILDKLYHPRVVLLVSCHIDFGDEKFSLSDLYSIEKYLSIPSSYPFYLKKFDLIRLINRNKLLNDYHKDDPTSTATLAYDDHGGISLMVPVEKRDSLLWSRPLVSKVRIEQYQALDSICKYFKERNVTLIYVQSPMKQSNCRSTQCKKFQATHIEKVKDIIYSHHHQFINLHQNNPYPDSLFADDIHLNFDGPKRFTLELIDKINLNQTVIHAMDNYSELSEGNI